MDITFKHGAGAFADAKTVRTRVFVEEQGFRNEFGPEDEAPEMIHVTLYGDGALLGCARVFPAALEPMLDDAPGRWVFGRLAVLPEAREGGLGSRLLAESERLAREAGAAEMHLHAQCGAQPFYEKAGYAAYSPIELDEHVEHQWMSKRL